MNIYYYCIFLLIIFFIIFFLVYNSSLEGWYSTGTINKTNFNPYYNSYYNPYFNGIRNPFSYNQYNYPILADSGNNSGAPIPYTNPIPINTIHWNYPPMLTSLKSPKNYVIGKWVYAGTAYTDNPNDFTNVDVEQLNLDPSRDLFQYRIRTKFGQIIPIKLPPYSNSLEDGDKFKIQGMEGRGDFIFNEADKYNYVYV